MPEDYTSRWVQYFRPPDDHWALLRLQSIVATTQQSRFHTETLETYCEDVDLKQLTLTVGDKELLTDADLRLFSGRRYGLVGANGSGKCALRNPLQPALSSPGTLNE